MEIVLGALFLIVWAPLILWMTARVAISAWLGKDQGVAIGLLAGAALTSGIVLFFKNLLPVDTSGLGFVLAAVGALLLWGAAKGK
jgi:hypothetical protein